VFGVPISYQHEQAMSRKQTEEVLLISLKNMLVSSCTKPDHPFPCGIFWWG